MEAMAPDEMDQGHRQKIGREELEDKVQDQIRAKDQEITGLRDEIKGLRDEIKMKEQEIRMKEQEIREVGKEIAVASGTGARELLEAELEFLRQEIRSIWQGISNRDLQISNRDQQIGSLRQQISNCDQQMSSIRQERSSLRSAQEASASAGVPETLQDLREYLAEKLAKAKLKKSVCLSSVSQSIWGALERQEGLKVVFKDLDFKPKRLSDLPAFGWDDRQERSQADRYISHLNKIASGREWRLTDAANNHPTLLSGSFGGWSFKGTTAEAFVHRKAGKYKPCRGLKCIFELKKDLRGGRDKAELQTLVCLVMANVLAKQFSPFAVLTDLDDSWSLYWMDGATIYWYEFESRAFAVGCIEDLLQDSDDNKMGTSDENMRFFKKRRMYEPPGMENLKDLVGLIPDEEILSAQVQLGVQHLQKLLHSPFFSCVPDEDKPWLAT